MEEFTITSNTDRQRVSRADILGKLNEIKTKQNQMQADINYIRAKVGEGGNMATLCLFFRGAGSFPFPSCRLF